MVHWRNKWINIWSYSEIINFFSSSLFWGSYGLTQHFSSGFSRISTTSVDNDNLGQFPIPLRNHSCYSFQRRKGNAGHQRITRRGDKSFWIKVKPIHRETDRSRTVAESGSGSRVPRTMVVIQIPCRARFDFYSAAEQSLPPWDVVPLLDLSRQR